MKREFYPMITSTIKTLIRIANNNDLVNMMKILRQFPISSKSIPNAIKTNVILTLLDELNRQYARWNTGGTK